MTGAIAGSPEDGVRAFAAGERWVEGTDYVLGKTKVWVSWDAWRDVDDRARIAEEGMRPHAAEEEVSAEGAPTSEAHAWGDAKGRKSVGSMAFGGSQEDLLYQAGGVPSSAGGPRRSMTEQFTGLGPPPAGWSGSGEWDKGSADGDPFTPPATTKDGAVEMSNTTSKGGYANLPGGESNHGSAANFFPTGKKGKEAKPVEIVPTTKARRWWVRFVWLLTWWIPSFLLIHIGGMKRSDIRMAWREKVTICFLIFFLCGTVLFYVIIFGKLLCPEFDRAWNADELLGHDADDNFWVSISGSVYDITTFWKGDHSIPEAPMTSDIVKPWAGTDISNYFPPPLDLACAGLVTNDLLEMRFANASTVPLPSYAVHTSGALQSMPVCHLSLCLDALLIR